MSVLKRLFRAPVVQSFLGGLLAGYLKLVRTTSRIEILPSEDDRARLEAAQPVVLAMWHGQHLMMPLLKRPHDQCSVLISKHGDGELNAIAVRKLGFGLVRGSGAQRADQIRKRGGTEALRSMLAVLEAGGNMALTADVPKISRLCGQGIILVAAMSGRPIVPVAVVCRPRIDFKSWDAASLGLPFGRAAVIIGEPVCVARDAEPEAREGARRFLEGELDRIHALGYRHLGAIDPGAGRAPVEEARRRQRARSSVGDAA